MFLYLAIKKDLSLYSGSDRVWYLIVNIYPDIMVAPEDSANGVGGLLHYFYILDEWVFFLPLIFMGVGAMTDFRSADR